MGDKSGAAWRGVSGRDADLKVGPECAFGVLIEPGKELNGLVGVVGAYDVQVAVIREGCDEWWELSIPEKLVRGIRGARKNTRRQSSSSP